MKYSISLLILFYASTLLSSCLKTNDKGQNFEDDIIYTENHMEENESDEDYPTNNLTENPQIVTKDSLKYFHIFDSNHGLVRSRLPFPSSWQQQSTGEFSYTGPNGIKVYREMVNMFMFSNDQQTNISNHQSGIPVGYPMSIDEVIETAFVPEANKINRKLIRKYNIPQLAAWDKQFDDNRFKSLPQRKTFQVVGLEWRDPDGTSFITILHHFVSIDDYGGFWGFTRTALESSEKGFAKAKNQYITGLLNQQINPLWLQAINQKELQMAIEQNAGHQERMGRIIAAGQQSTAAHNARMAAMDKDMANWRSNGAANDRTHAGVIDNIRGETNVSNPNSGTTYKVDAGAGQYWMNNQGEYITSDNSLYNPNLNSGTNNQTWTEYNE